MLSKYTNSFYDTQVLMTYRVDPISWLEECYVPREK